MVNIAIRKFSDAGSPEGSVAAPPGSIYSQTDAEVGKELWFKATGTGNTGWSLGPPFPNAESNLGATNVGDAIAELETKVALADEVTQHIEELDASKASAESAYRRYMEVVFKRDTLATGTIPERFFIPFDGQIEYVTLTAQTPSTSGSIVADINYAESATPNTFTTLYETQANRPTLVANAYGVSATLPDFVQIPSGSFLSVDLDSIGTGASNVRVQVGYSFYLAPSADEEIIDEEALLAYLDEVLADGPAVYLRLEETTGTTAQDATENNLDGTYVNTPTLDANGALPATNAATFTAASSEHITVAHNALLDLAEPYTFTFECWLKRASIGTLQVLADKGTGAYRVYIGADNKVYLEKKGTGTIVSSTSTITDTSAFHHIVLSTGPDGSVAVIDGVDVTLAGTLHTLGNTATTLYIGSDSTGANYLDGTLDEVAIYPYDISSFRATRHYEAALAEEEEVAPPEASYFDAVLFDAPAMYLRLGEATGTGADDQSGNNLVGTYVNTPTLAVTGAVSDDTAVTLATNEYISVADANLLDVGDTLSLELWLKTSTTATLQQLISKDTAYGLRINTSNQIEFTGGGQTLATSTATVADNAWHHVVATKSGTTRVIYVDGVAGTTAGTNATLANNTSPLHIGAVSPTPGTYFNGSIDEVAVYPTALSAARVTIHQSYGAGTATATTTTFAIAAGADDQQVKKTASVYPPTGSVARYTTGNRANVNRTLALNGTYEISNLLFSFDTSSLPDAANITEAILRIRTETTLNANGREFTGDWHAWDGTDADYAEAADTDAFSIPIGSITPEAINDIPLSNLTNISKTGATKLRLHISGGLPTGYNYVGVFLYEHTTNPAPELIVTYTT